MQIRKKLILPFFVSILAVTTLVVGGILLYQANKTWDDSETWSYSDKLNLPVTTNSNLKLKLKDEKEGQVSITVPYCLLYDSQVVSDTETKLLCSTLPYYSQELLNRFPTKLSLTPDIVINHNSQKDALPSQYLDRITIDVEALQALGSVDHAVEISMRIQFSKPQKTLSALVSHLTTVQKGEKEKYESVRISEWNVSPVKLAKDYTAGEKKQIIQEWRKAAWAELNTVLNTESFLNKTTEQELLNTMATTFQTRMYYCPPVAIGGKCEVAYEGNASTNILYYIYNAYYFDKPVFNKIVGIFRNRVLPFVRIYNPERAAYYDSCSDEECGGDYFSLEQYDTQACPTLELGKKGKSDLEQFFLDFRKKKAEEFVDSPLVHLESKSYFMDLLNIAREDFKESKNERRFSYNVMLGMDDLCYKVLRDDLQDKDEVNGWKDVYADALWQQLIIQERETNKSIEDSLFELVLSATVLNSHDSVLIPSPALTYQRLLTGVQKQDNLYKPEGYWSSIADTMQVLYLTSSYAE